MIVLAQRHRALIVAVEHRYYGLSIPVPDFSTPNLRFLSTYQALEDTALFHQHLRSTQHVHSVVCMSHMHAARSAI